MPRGRPEQYNRERLRGLIEAYEEGDGRWASFHAMLVDKAIPPVPVYNAMKRHELSVPTNDTPWEVHIILQRRLAVPPDVYAARNNLTLSTFQRAARELKKPLGMTKHHPKRDWWLETIDRVDWANVTAWCFAEHIPVWLLAQNFHRYVGSEQPLLWGFGKTHTINQTIEPGASDLDNEPRPDYLLGHGRSVQGVLRPFAQRLRDINQ